MSENDFPLGEMDILLKIYFIIFQERIQVDLQKLGSRVAKPVMLKAEENLAASKSL